MDILENNEYDEQVRWLKKSEIEREKHELFHDFISILLKNVDDTFLGSEYIFDEIDMRRHFKWCWDKTVDGFEKERIFFIKGDHVNLYFYTLLLNTFYRINEDKNPMETLKDHMDFLFSDESKSNLEFDFYYNTYMELRDSLKNYGRIM